MTVKMECEKYKGNPKIWIIFGTKGMLGNEKKRCNWMPWDLGNVCYLDLRKGVVDWWWDLKGSILMKYSWET